MLWILETIRFAHLLLKTDRSILKIDFYQEKWKIVLIYSHLWRDVTSLAFVEHNLEPNHSAEHHILRMVNFSIVLEITEKIL